MRSIMRNEIVTAGQRLRAEREREGLTQAGLAAVLVCSERTVFALESGQTTPRVETAVAIQRRYGIPVADWVDAANVGTGKDAA